MSHLNGYEPDIERLQRAYADRTIDTTRSINELLALAEAKSTLAPLYLGWAYQHGQGVPENTAEAARWFKAGLARGDATCSYYLGHLYDKTALHNEASDVFEQGSTLGYIPSTYCLAMNTLEGRGRQANLESALKLLALASGGGHVFARRTMATLYLSGKFGLLQFPRGIWLLVSSVIRGVYLAIFSPDDIRLKA